MKKLIVIALIAVAGYKAWAHFTAPELKPLYDKPYVVVYGRETCGFTQSTIDELRRARIEFEFGDVDDQAVADELHSRMRIAGLDTSYYLLPVVDLNNSLTVRPENAELIERARPLIH
jgi:hypothetical protein